MARARVRVQEIGRFWLRRRSVLMKRLGYTQFVAQGGDWGALVTDVMAQHAPPELLGIHSNMPGMNRGFDAATLERLLMVLDKV